MESRDQSRALLFTNAVLNASPYLVRQSSIFVLDHGCKVVESCVRHGAKATDVRDARAPISFKEAIVDPTDAPEELTAEQLSATDLGQQRSGSRFANAGNRRQEIALALEVRMVVEVLANLPFNLSDLLVKRGEDLANGSFCDSRLGRLLIDRLLHPRYLEMLVMAHKSL